MSEIHGGIGRNQKETRGNGRRGSSRRGSMFWPGSRKMPVKDSVETYIDIRLSQAENLAPAAEGLFSRDNRSGSEAVFAPGQVIECDYLVNQWELLRGDDRQVTSVENSILWRTEGKGDSDIGIHFFERRTSKTENVKDSKRFFDPYKFRTICPNSPLTYEGDLISITWMVRVRFFLKSGRNLTADRNFKVRF